MYIISNGTARIVDEDAFTTSSNLPNGIWKINYQPMTGAVYFTKSTANLSHGKIYGATNKIVDHCVERFEKDTTGKNLGVLFSGRKGLGKSLAIRLIEEKLVDKYPVIIVDAYTGMLPSILSQLSGCVIIFDEFEKMTRSGDDEGGPTCQESLLTVLDGTAANKHNFYLFSVNDVDELNDNLICRPGRILYHYVFDSLTPDEIKEYCNDNLTRKDIIPEVVNCMRGAEVRSFDVLSCLVNELNTFEDVSPADASKYLNIFKYAPNCDVTATLVDPEGKEYSVYAENVRNSHGEERFAMDYDTGYRACIAKVNFAEYSSSYIDTLIKSKDIALEDAYELIFDEDRMIDSDRVSRKEAKEWKLKNASFKIHSSFEW